MNALDRLISWLSPEMGASRAQARARSKLLERLGTYPQSTPGRMDAEIHGRGQAADVTLELGYDRRKIVDRARELERTSVLAEGLLSRSTEAVIGDGFRLQMESGDDALDEEIEARWNDWCEHEADYRELSNFAEIQSHVYRSKMRDGDVAAVLMNSGALRLVESDEIASPDGGAMNRSNMVDGVELDSAGRPKSFYVFDWDPKTIWTDRRSAINRLVRIPSKDVIFCARRLRAGQTRGLSAFTNLFWILEQVEDSIEAVTVAMRMAACFGLVIKQSGPMVDLNVRTDGTGRSRQSMRLEPAMVKRLEIGEDIEQIQPTHPGPNFESHVEGLIRLAGVPFGLPLEVTLRNFTKSNFSNTRAALLQAWHTWSRQQNEMKRFCTRVFMWKLLNWYPNLKPEQTKHSWQAPGWAWIDPVAEVQASMLAVDAGYDSPQRVIARTGGDWKEIQRERKEWAEAQEADELAPAMSNLSRDPPKSHEEEMEMMEAQAKLKPAPGDEGEELPPPKGGKPPPPKGDQ